MSPRVSRFRRRGGFTLRELSIAMSVGSVVLMTATGILHRAFDWAQVSRHRRHDDQTYFRLRQQFCQDVRGAESVDGDESSLAIVLAGGGTAKYQIRSGGVTREESRESPPVRRESYRWRIEREMQFELDDSAGEVRLRGKTVTPHPTSATPLWHLTRASIGLRQKYQRGEVAP